MKRGDSRPILARTSPFIAVAVRRESPFDSLRWQDPAVNYRTRRVRYRYALAATRDVVTVANSPGKSATPHHLEMSAVDGADPNVALEPLDAKAEEEERYRLKMVALQECYDNVALQSVRLRERIYQVKKQCRRLEVMKRVALNMLHQNTGTYDIPPLEIVDEDPLPSFLESLHKQQHVVAEPPRKKSKRPSRSKSDGKPTPEEEERAKQKIYSIIDSVYSETARRMGDALKKPSRNPNMMTASSSEQSSRKVGDLTMSSNQTSPEASVKSLHVEHETKPEIHGEASSMTLNQRDSSGAEEQAKSGHALASFDSMPGAYEPSMSLEESMAYDSAPMSSKTSHNMSTSSSSLGFTYGDSNDGLHDLSRGASASNSPAYETLETLQSMNYHVDAGAMTQQVSQKSLDYEVPREGNSMFNLTDSVVSPVQNHADNLDPDHTAAYSKTGSSNKTVRSNELEQHLSRLTDLSFNKSLSSSPHHIDGEKINHASGSGDPSQASKKGRLTARTDVKQDTSRTASAPPPPNYIPYRMIEVETPKPVEVITIDSGDETSSPKQIRKRRRKYKYVVESVLDNVPYTFRQAESDDEEAADKQSTTVSTPVRTATD